MSAADLSPARIELSNGLTVLHQRNPSSASVSISLSVAAGGVFDPTDKRGLSTLVARGLTRGTAWRSKVQIGEILDFRGAHLGGSATRHAAGIGAKSRAEDFEVLLELMSESARQPLFPDAEVEKLKGDRLTALREDADDPAIVVMDTFRELAYPSEHPYSWRLRGYEQSVEAITAADLREFHAAWYRPSAALLIVVGDVERGRALEAVEGCFGAWSSDAGVAGGYRAAQATMPDAPALSEIRRQVVAMPDKSQVDVALGHASIRRDDPRYYAAVLLNMILGRFAMGGRLGCSVREEQGMAYYTYSVLQAGLGPGPFLVRAGVQPEHVDPAVASIVAEIDRIRGASVDVEELDNAKAATVRSLPLTLESNEGVAAVLQQIELYGLGLDYLSRFAGLIDAVDREAVLEAARQLLHPEGYAVAIAGPYAAGED